MIILCVVRCAEANSQKKLLYYNNRCTAGGPKPTGRDFNWLSFLPRASGFGGTSSGVREYIGRLYYELKFA